MKISNVESNKALANSGEHSEKILPEHRPKRSAAERASAGAQLSPLERGMALAESALVDVPDVREEIVNELKERIARGEYEVSGQDIAEMMLRRRAADDIR